MRPLSASFVPDGGDAGAGSLPRLWSGRVWGSIGAAALVLFVLVPVCNLVVPETSAFHVSDTWSRCSARSCATRSSHWRWT